MHNVEYKLWLKGLFVKYLVNCDFNMPDNVIDKIIEEHLNKKNLFLENRLDKLSKTLTTELKDKTPLFLEYKALLKESMDEFFVVSVISMYAQNNGYNISKEIEEVLKRTDEFKKELVNRLGEE